MLFVEGNQLAQSLDLRGIKELKIILKFPLEITLYFPIASATKKFHVSSSKHQTYRKP